MLEDLYTITIIKLVALLAIILGDHYLMRLIETITLFKITVLLRHSGLIYLHL